MEEECELKKHTESSKLKKSRQAQYMTYYIIHITYYITYTYILKYIIYIYIYIYMQYMNK